MGIAKCSSPTVVRVFTNGIVIQLLPNGFTMKVQSLSPISKLYGVAMCPQARNVRAGEATHKTAPTTIPKFSPELKK